MPVSRPIEVVLPDHGLVIAESIHGPRFRMAERADPFHKVLYVLQGRVTFARGAGRRSVVGAGAVLCVRAGVRHRLADEEPSTLLLLCFSGEFVARDVWQERLWGQLASRDGTAIRFAGRGGPRFEGFWQAGIAEQAGRQPGREVALRAAAGNILVALSRLPATHGADAATERVSAVVRELAENFYEAWSLERARARAGISRRHFSQIFRQITGQSFLAHLTGLRLAHAAQLLRQRRHSIVGAAFSCGYGDLSHFYRLFRARFGQPPRAWMESLDGHQSPEQGGVQRRRSGGG